MANVFDVAKYILDAEGSMTTMKLQKLCYYAQAWSLVWDDSERFPEEFEAWANGPVCRELFDWHKPAYKVASQDIPSDKLSQSGDPFSDTQKDTLNAVLRDYGQQTGRWLSELTHMEAPWINARQGCAPGSYCDNIIPKGNIAWYYDSL